MFPLSIDSLNVFRNWNCYSLILYFYSYFVGRYISFAQNVKPRFKHQLNRGLDIDRDDGQQWKTTRFSVHLEFLYQSFDLISLWDSTK